MSNKEKAEWRLAELNRAVDSLVLVIPGINCSVVKDAIKTIRSNISILGAEIDNHG